LNYGLDEFPKRSSISIIVSLLNEHINGISEIALDTETIYVDGTYVSAKNSKENIVFKKRIKPSLL